MVVHKCPQPGCQRVIPISQPYCDEHISRHKQYDQSIRLTVDAKYHGFYLSAEWVKAKQIICNKYHGLCLWSYYHGAITQYEEIHHVEPLRLVWSRRTDISNLVPLTHEAHMMAEAEYRKGNMERMQRELFGLIERWDKEFGTR